MSILAYQRLAFRKMIFCSRATYLAHYAKKSNKRRSTCENTSNGKKVRNVHVLGTFTALRTRTVPSRSTVALDSPLAVHLLFTSSAEFLGFS